MEIDLRMTLNREKIHDTLDCLVGVVGVQSADTEMAGFGKRDGGFHGFRIADFTDEDHVGRLAQRVLERVLK